jgi:uncharacterized membrane protein YfcA
LPFHIFVWKTIDQETLKMNLILSPAILIGFYLGIKLVKIINNDLYRKLVLLVTAIGALIILLR